MAVGYGNLVQIWRIRADSNDGTALIMPFELHRTLSGFVADVISLQWSADGSALLASARDNTAKLFTLRKLHGYVPITFTGHKTPVIGAFFW